MQKHLQVHELKGQVIEEVPKPHRGGDHECILLYREANGIHMLNSVGSARLNTAHSYTCFIDEKLKTYFIQLVTCQIDPSGFRPHTNVTVTIQMRYIYI